LEAERWNHVEQLLQAALELNEQQRAEYLQQACAGDEGLRREVESLLAFAKDAENFIETPALEVAAEALSNEHSGPRQPEDVESRSLEGKTVSHYEVLEKLGGGGMGIVYKARDTKLGRFVALKFLPSDLAQDHQAIDRFRREAYAASALNHRNICTIYDIDEYQGAPFIAMEFLAGQTLKQCIENKQLNLDRLLDLAIQISRALDAAHTQGIIHRDIKPANVFIADDGTAKVLDFGVAKLVHGSTDIAPASMTAATVDLHDSVTSPGTVLGTVMYMSPEQVRGEELDARTDLFSLGVVLYEMATGRKPFTGNSTSIITEAILHRAPIPAGQLNPALPHRLEEVVNKALEKDRNLRIQHASDLRAELQRLKRDTDSGRRLEVAAGSGTAGTAEVAISSANTSSVFGSGSRKREWEVATVVIGLCLLAAAGYGIYELLNRSGPIAFQNFTVTQATDSGKVALAAISPDGKYLLSVQRDKGQESLWLRNLPTSSETQVLPLSAAIYSSLMFSQDGNYIYYRKAIYNSAYAFDLYRAPVLGGTPRLIVKDIDTGITLSPDGTRMAYARWQDPEAGKLRLLSAKPDGTDEKVLHIGPYYPKLISVAWSPDKKRIGCALEQPGNAEGGIDLFDLSNGTMRTFVRFDDKIPEHIVWLPDGSGLLMLYEGKLTHSSRPQIGFVSYPRGEFRTVTNDTNSYQEFTLSADAKILATVQERIESEVDLLPGTGGGTPSTLPGIAKQMVVNDVSWAGNRQLLLSEDTRLVRVAADGTNPVNLLNDSSARIQSAATCNEDRSIVFSSVFHGKTNSYNVWRADADGSNPEKLTEGKVDWSPVCTPDGKWVYFADSSEFQVMRVPIKGGRPEQVPGSDVPNSVFFPIALSLDGKMLAFIPSITSPPSQKLALLNLGANSETALRFLEVDSRAAPFVQFTPDGKAVAYVIEDQGVDNVWVQPFDGSKGRKITNFTSEQITDFHWSPDGRSLALLRTDATHDAILLRASEP
jgi:eukaryotic-like serine/threonine-protein kinase